jgi:hypothetical protein
MANDPPFATLNHVAGDLGIPSESALLRIGITRLCRCVWLPCFWAFCMAVFGVPGLTAPDGVQSASGDGRGVARPIAVWRTICHRRRRRLSDDDLVDLARAIWQEQVGKSDLARAAIPGEAADSGKPGRAFAGRTICSTNAALASRQIAPPAAPPQLAQYRLAMTWQ